MRAKHILGDFEWFFVGGQDFFDPKIVFRAAKAVLGSKKSRPPSKNLEKTPIICFISIRIRDYLEI
jgi:hypothetical protein